MRDALGAGAQPLPAPRWPTRRSAGTPVAITLGVRRLFCDAPDCPKQTFAEQIPGLTSRYGRRSVGLGRMLARPGWRWRPYRRSLGARLGLVASRSTLLRMIRRVPDPPVGAVAVLGIDDFAQMAGGRDLAGTEGSGPGPHRTAGSRTSSIPPARPATRLPREPVVMPGLAPASPQLSCQNTHRKQRTRHNHPPGMISAIESAGGGPDRVGSLDRLGVDHRRGRQFGLVRRPPAAAPATDRPRFPRTRLSSNDVVIVAVGWWAWIWLWQLGETMRILCRRLAMSCAHVGLWLSPTG